MTIDKAIKVLVEWDILSAHEVDLELRRAVGLGIEALKRVQGSRLNTITITSTPLPGETKIR